MKMISTFKICIEKYSTSSKKDLIEWTKELLSNPEKDRKKELRSFINHTEVFYKLIVTHKKTGISEDSIYNSRREVSMGMLDLMGKVREKIQESRKIQRERASNKKYAKNYKYYLVGMVHESPGDFKKAMFKAIVDKFYASKKPKNKKKHIGVELELYIPKAYDEKLAYDLYEMDKSLIDKVCIKDDGSLRPKDNESDIEIAIVDTEDSIYNTVSKILSILNANGARVDKRCGLHVHVDMRDRVAEIAFHNFVQAQNVMFKMLTKDRKANEFCEPVKKTSIYSYYGSSRRYWSINATSLQKFNTIEIRMHHGTLDTNRINNWIDLLVKIADKKSKVKSSFRSIKSLGRTFKLPKPMIDYSDSLIKKEMSA